MKQIKDISFPVLLVGVLILAGCNKNKLYKIDTLETKVHFTGAKNQTYSIVTNPAPAYNLIVGTTDVANVDRTVEFNVTSPTGAVAGNEYTLGTTGNTVTILAGQATATIVVQGKYDAFTAGQKDTLVFTLTEPSKVAGFSDTVNLELRGLCFEGDVNLNAFLGNYIKTNETFGASPYGPYTTSISAVNLLTPTTGTITVENIFDFGWGPITFTLDWTDPANRTATVVTQSSGIADAGTLSSAYAGEQVAVRPFAGQPGTFSACSGTLTLRMDLGVAGLGFFGELYTVNMAR